MKLNILAFGIAKEMIGSNATGVDVGSEIKVEELKTLLQQQFPNLSQLRSFMIAVNGEYATAGQLINPQDEIAIIPPVSGG